MKLSICMMVKDEETNLPRCLASLHSLLTAVQAELIIVDTGSSDSTVGIAQSYTDKVYFHPWENDFSGMRNITISYATGEWILIIDADEELEDATDIIKMLNSTPDASFGAASVMVTNVVAENAATRDVFVGSPRLFKNDGYFHYAGTVHNQPLFNGNVQELHSKLRHYGYVSSDKALMDRKFRRTAELLKLELEKNPESLYYRYQLAVSYNMHHDKAEAFTEILKAYEMLQARDCNQRQYLYIYHEMVIAYLDRKNYREAETVCLEALQLEPRHIDLYFFLGKIYLGLDKLDDARKYYLKFIKMLDTFAQSSITSDLSLKFATPNRNEEAYLDIFNIYMTQKKYVSAQRYLAKVTQKEYTKLVFQAYVKLYFAMQKLEKLKQYYEQTVLQEEDESLIDAFLLALEGYRQSASAPESAQFAQIFAKGTTDYARLNQVRLLLAADDSKALEHAEQLAAKVDLNKLIYTDLIYCFLHFNSPLGAILSRIAEKNINAYLDNLLKLYPEAHQLLVDNINVGAEAQDFATIRTNKIVGRFLLLRETLEQDFYATILHTYIDSGIQYLQAIYSEKVIMEELIYDVGTAAEAALIMVLLAQTKGASDDAMFIKYLRRAIHLDAPLVKGYKILLDAKQQRFNEVAAAQNEFALYQVQVKQVIADLIDASRFDEASNIIAEYQTMVQDDPEIVQLLGRIETAGNAQH
ncbi:MAG: glycosyltransferase [Peptococcaceae bacterium]|nr:glycosyltransferase [Peptococcaceae bacterium]